jgi:membrane-associated phospholipid phosphatase
MSKAGLVPLRPLESDLMIARASARIATPGLERPLRLVTLLADEKATLMVAAAVWLAARYSRRDRDREEANRMLCGVLVAGAVPHLFKLLVRRRRPNRSIKGGRDGIPRSGNAWDSFPSGHAVHLGAMAPSAARLAPPFLRPFVWPGLLSLAATRILILAHYPTDVIAGFGIGVAINKAAAALLRRWR